MFLRPTLADPPAILTKRDAEALRAVLEDPARHHPRSVERYLLTGILVCGECGGRMQGHPARGRRYMCRSTGVMHRTIVARDVEDLVIVAVSERQAELATVGDPAGVQGPILKQLDAVDAKLAAFAENAALAGMPANAIRSGTKALLAERERLEAELDAVQPPSPPTSYADAMADEQELLRAEVEALVDHVLIGPPIPPVNVFNPARVEIVWR
jgi:hypothetical protein